MNNLLKKKSLLFILLILPAVVFSQTREEEMANARQYFQEAQQLQNQSKIDEAETKFLEASAIYKKYEAWKNYLICEYSAAQLMNFKADYDNALSHLLDIENKSVEIFGDSSNFVSAVYHLTGELYYQKAENEKSLQYFDKSLKIKKKLHGENSIEVAKNYNSIANVYAKIGEFNVALNFYKANLAITKAVMGESHPDIAITYTNIANIYINQGEYDKAIEQKQEVLDIMLVSYGEVNPQVADAYAGIGNAYIDKKEYETAKEYLLKSIEIKKKVYGESHLKVADDYVNLGIIFNKTENLDYSIQYYFIALEIYKSSLGENHPEVAAIYNNIGLVFQRQGNNSQALEYYEYALKIKTQNFGEKNPEVAAIYTNIGSMYMDEQEFDKALTNFEKSISINKSIFGNHHPNIVEPYLNMASIYFDKKEHEKALENYQNALIANVATFNKSDYYQTPSIDKPYDKFKFLRAMQGKAKSFFLKYESEKNIKDLTISLEIFQKCDTLISSLRKTVTSEKDKIALGEVAYEVYDNAITTCLYLENQTKNENYKLTAFYFSERNKSGTLLQAIAGAKAQEFAGIPDSLLQKEKMLREKITYYEQQLAELYDFSKEDFYRNKLFEYNTKYYALIDKFEKEYPKYYQMKYNTTPLQVADLQNMLDEKTAMFNYFLGETDIFLFVITPKNIEIFKTPKDEDLNSNIEIFNDVILSPYPEDVAQYHEKSFWLYNQLFPKKMPKKIEKLVIVPDGILGTLSFEALFYEEYKGELKKYVDFPFVIKKYNIAYTYSSNLYHAIFSDVSQYSANRPTKDWLGIAPVFKDDNSQMFNGSSVETIEGTEAEVNQIKEKFEKKKYKVDYRLNQNANETELKKNINVGDYKFVHIATHGVVNSENPDLSAILLSPSGDSEDGILYAGEIYNMELNSDIVVLSACETALGKISKGEGVIGLSRAIMYAGSRNMVLSLWKVADKPTTQLMVYFYQNILDENKNFNEMPNFSDALYKAKLQIIEDGKYAHPYFWSAFILIGK